MPRNRFTRASHRIGINLHGFLIYLAMLYAAKNIESTLNRLLEIIGRSYDVSRAYIFESSEDRMCCSNTFEWCAEDVEPQGIRSMLQCAILDEGEFVGYVGFDECRENRSWSPAGSGV